MVLRWSSLLAVGALAAVGGPDPAIAAGCSPGGPAAECARCHPTIHEEWSTSRHAGAWNDRAYRAALSDLEHPQRCHGCHAPSPVLARLGRPPRARDQHREEGVTCTACHDVRGRIGGPFGAPTDAHPSQIHPAFDQGGSLHLCGSCHDLKIGPVLPLARDFRTAGLAARGKSCVGCHMPRTRRAIAVDPETGADAGPERRGRSHALRGPADPDFCADAFKIGLRRDGDRLELSVGNRAGHRVPGLTTRSFELEVVQRDAGGAELRRDDVTVSAANPLWVAETRRFRFALGAGVSQAEIVVVHRHGGRTVEILRRTEQLVPPGDDR